MLLPGVRDEERLRQSSQGIWTLGKGSREPDDPGGKDAGRAPVRPQSSHDLHDVVVCCRVDHYISSGSTERTYLLTYSTFLY